MLNQIVIVGRLSKTPEIMKNQDGSKFTILSLAVPRSFKNDEGVYETDFIDCTVTGTVAEQTCTYCKNGDLVGVKGRMQNLNHTAQLQIVVEKVSFLSSKSNEE